MRHMQFYTVDQARTLLGGIACLLRHIVDQGCFQKSAFIEFDLAEPTRLGNDFTPKRTNIDWENPIGGPSEHYPRVL